MCLDLSCNERQFPQGMKAVADEIRVLGFKPGLWIVPWGTGNKAFYDAHRSWFIHEPDGRPMSAWPGRYILDITNDDALFNWGEERQRIPVSFEELGLDADGEYALYETWEEKWLGYAKDGFSVDVPPHAVRLVAVHPRSDRPVLLSSDRHITRGAQDVASVALKGTALAFDVRLVADHPVMVRFLLPDGWRYEGSDADCRLEAGGRILAVHLVSPRSETVSRTIPLSVR